MIVLFAPDYRSGNPYQSMLANALAAHGVQVEYLSTYRRVLPLTRGMSGSAACLLHLHWPEAYFSQTGRAVGFVRTLRFPLDLRFAIRHRALVLTVHNLVPHDWKVTPAIQVALGSAFQLAHRIVAHSKRARELVISRYHIPAQRVVVIPHGDLTSSDNPLPDQRKSRKALGLLDGRAIVVMFGRVEPYKGIDDLVAFWKDSMRDCTLLIAGDASRMEYAVRIQELAAGVSNVIFKCGRISEEELRCLLGAATAVVFNYKHILTSGGANLARSYGVPILLPTSVDSLDLQEPDPRVFRFSSFEELPELVRLAGAVGTNYQAAAEFRKQCSWKRVAELTKAVYEDALECAAV